ncbi:MAG TPA: protein liaI [Bacillales bacterium]|nr:protein liaI [Bacillales bacterium]
MNITGKFIGGIALVLLGGWLLLGMFGVHLGGLIALLFGIVLICFGVKKLKQDHKVLGVISLIFGFMFLGGSLPFLISLALAAVCIYFGWKLIKQERHQSEPAAAYSGDTEFMDYRNVKVEDSFDREWEDFLRKNPKDND